MSRKNKNAPSAQAESGRSARSIAWFGKTLAGGAAAIVLALGVAVFWLQLQQVQQSRESQVRVGAQGLAARLGDIARHYQLVVGAIVADPELSALYSTGDERGLRRRENALRLLLPDALSIRLLPAGPKAPDTTVTPHLSYSSLDLLRKAEGSPQAPPLEVHQFNSGQAHIALAQRVPPQADAPLGVLHVAVPVGRLQQALDRVTDYGGSIEIQQKLADGTIVGLASSGLVPTGGKKPDGRVQVPGTIWQVVYWHAPLTAVQWRDYLVLLGLVVAAVAGLVLLVFLLVNRLRSLLTQDQSSLARLLDDFFGGALERDYPAALADMEPTLKLMQQRAANALRTGSRAARSDRPAEESGDAESAGAPPGGRGEEEAGDGIQVPAEIFRAYDIRGVVGVSFSARLVYEIGRAIGSEAFDRGDQTLVVGRDGRNSSPELSDALCRGLQASGREVVDLGMVPTPVVYFATHYLGANAGVMVTGSHNPPEYNGLKIVLAGEALSGDAIQVLRKRIESGNLTTGEGARQEQNLVPDYINRINEDVRVARPMKVVVDAGNGVAGAVMPALLRAMGCEVSELFCEIDGNFPNHHPDPSNPDNLQSLILEVKAREADLGVAIDGDGDRLGVVDSSGNIIWPDRLLMLLAADVLSRNPGADIIFDVKSSRNLASEIVKGGGRPMMSQTGHSLIKARMKETGALLAGEMSGHIFFQERWFGFDDALYATARLLEILSADPRSTADIFAELPESVVTPELHLDLEEGQSASIVERVVSEARFPGAKLITLDGLRAEFEDGWGLVRASNTTPSLVFRFEADSEEAMRRIKGEFRSLLHRLEPDLKLPF